MSPRRRPGHLPKLSHVKRRGIGRVRIDGHDHYIGRAGDWPASQRRPPPHILDAYNRLMAEYQAAVAAPKKPTGPTAARPLRQLVEPFLASSGYSAQRAATARSSLARLLASCGDATPRGLAAEMVVPFLDGLRGLARATAREYVAMARAFLRWTGVPRSVRDEIADRYPTRGLGRATARVPDAPPASVEAVLAHGSPRVAALVQVQLLTGMRPGEACRLTPGEIVRPPTNLEQCTQVHIAWADPLTGAAHA